MTIIENTALKDLFRTLAVSGLGGSGRDVAFKDDVNSQWLCYRYAENVICAFSFGEVATNTVNMAVTLERDNPNFEMNYENYLKNGTDKVFLDYMVNAVNVPAVHTGLTDLRNLLLTMPKYRAGLNPSDFEYLCANFWYKYAGLYDFDNWGAFFSDIDELQLDGYPNTEAFSAYQHFNASYGDRCVETVPFALSVNGTGVLGRAFLLDPLFGATALFPMDLLYMFRNHTAVHVCARCGQLYINNNLSSRYCPECYSVVGKKGISNENRRKNRARYLHKRILDKLNSKANTRAITSADFRAESNYYWDLINGRTPKITPKAITNIHTEEEYIAWLENILPDPYRLLNHRYD